ncbi:MAG: 2Fe-2S iron-sulfur cluster binding domain-containing protein [Desulfobacterales bacterium]|nr:2Fe-2S iron-sulfur cluster binding domain-containing protein [Desulfobacterales bacterium]
MVAPISEKKFVAKVFRFDPSKEKEPRYETYEGPLVPQMNVMDVLRYIYETYDNLAFRVSCGGGSMCGICRIKVNGKVGLACTIPATENMTIEPVDKDKVLRDLIVES